MHCTWYNGTKAREKRKVSEIVYIIRAHTSIRTYTRRVLPRFAACLLTNGDRAFFHSYSIIEWDYTKSKIPLTMVSFYIRCLELMQYLVQERQLLPHLQLPHWTCTLVHLPSVQWKAYLLCLCVLMLTTQKILKEGQFQSLSLHLMIQLWVSGACTSVIVMVQGFSILAKQFQSLSLQFLDQDQHKVSGACTSVK